MPRKPKQRFFVTGNATRPYKVKVPGKKQGEPDRTVPVDFVPMFPDGGNWVGYFETEDQALADAVAELGPPIHEVTAKSADEVKKSLELTKNRLDPRRTSSPSRPVDVNTALDLSQPSDAEKPTLASAQESFRFSDLVGEGGPGEDPSEGDLVEKGVAPAAEGNGGGTEKG